MNVCIRRILLKNIWLILIIQSSVESRNKCPLQCRNGGVCKRGISPSQTEDGRPSSRFFCHCLIGYAGPFCEVFFQPCPGLMGNSTFCSNGAPCIHDVSHDGDTFYHCQCSESHTDYTSLFARRICQHASTVFCTPENPVKKKQIQQSLGSASGSFCLNGGLCKNSRDRTAKGCDCPDDWRGPHCEIPANDIVAARYHYNQADESLLTDADIPSGQKRYRSTLIIICTFIAVSAVGSVIFAFYDGWRDSHERRRRKALRALTRIPTQISTKTRKRRHRHKFEPLEVEDNDEPENAGVFRD